MKKESTVGEQSPPTTQREFIDRLLELGFTVKNRSASEIHLLSQSGEILHLVKPEISDQIDVRKARIAEKIGGIPYGTLFDQTVTPTPKLVFGKPDVEPTKKIEEVIEVAKQETVFDVSSQSFALQVLYQFYNQPRKIMNLATVLKKTKLTKGQVSGSCSYLSKNGYLESMKRGDYRITSDGMSRMQSAINKSSGIGSALKKSQVATVVEKVAPAPTSASKGAAVAVTTQLTQHGVQAEIVEEEPVSDPMSFLKRVFPDWQDRIRSSEDLDAVAEWFDETENLLRMLNR